jgi:hypothetical protein
MMYAQYLSKLKYLINTFLFFIIYFFYLTRVGVTEHDELKCKIFTCGEYADNIRLSKYLKVKLIILTLTNNRKSKHD